jgi:ribonuclease J
LIVNIAQVNNIPPNKLLILTTGAQGEEEAALSKMAYSDYKGVTVKKGDTVIISAKTIAGNDRAVQNMIDQIMSKGAMVKQTEDLDLYTSGHGYQEDQKIMLNLVKPKFFMPVHGYQYFLRAHGDTARSVGVEDGNIIISKKGSIVEGSTATGYSIAKSFPCEPLLVSGSGVGDVGTVVLKEREQLASYGVVVIDIIVNKEKELVRDPFVISRGFVYVKNSQELIKQIVEKSKEIYNSMKGNYKEVSEVREVITTEVSDIVFEETQREPMIITVISFV